MFKEVLEDEEAAESTPIQRTGTSLCVMSCPRGVTSLPDSLPGYLTHYLVTSLTTSLRPLNVPMFLLLIILSRHTYWLLFSARILLPGHVLVTWLTLFSLFIYSEISLKLFYSGRELDAKKKRRIFEENLERKGLSIERVCHQSTNI